MCVIYGLQTPPPEIPRNYTDATLRVAFPTHSDATRRQTEGNPKGCASSLNNLIFIFNILMLFFVYISI